MIKAHFVREANIQMGRLRAQRVRLMEGFRQEQTWLSLNLNERQALLNRYLRGFYNGTSGSWEEFKNRADVPNYFYIWVTHQLIYGVVAGDGYSGWDWQGEKFSKSFFFFSSLPAALCLARRATRSMGFHWDFGAFL